MRSSEIMRGVKIMELRDKHIKKSLSIEADMSNVSLGNE